jgi:hypothetical protein
MTRRDSLNSYHSTIVNLIVVSGDSMNILICCGATKVLAIFYPKVLQSKYSLSLPFVNTQPTSRSLPTQNVPVDPLRPILRNSHVNRRHIRAYQTIKSIETSNRTAEAVREDSGARAQKLRRNIGDPRKASQQGSTDGHPSRDQLPTHGLRDFTTI